jgi:cytochrome P450
MEAGSDTTASTLLSFILAMIKYPQTLQKAQAEVDAVCGDRRSPSFDDIKDLVYLKACMNEVTIIIDFDPTNLIRDMQTLRWRPVAAGGIPHMLTEDDVYEGYSLPKGTILFANAWSIHRDEDEYAQPEDFIPERFIKNKFGSRFQEGDSPENARRTTYGFGAGRRVCPGQRLAENSLVSPRIFRLFVCHD